ncbi:MAG TPA: SDR family oxidoreductase [Caulobacteraceae bacterium]|nr:SDR family oxidoreductase [Caulobacteraceae bacterium]
MRGKIVVVTGGLGVLGRAVVAAAKAAGAKTAAVDVGQGGSDADLTLGGVDLVDPAAAAAAMNRIAAELGGVNALANIAGGFVWTHVADGGADAWAAMHRMNLGTALGATLAALPHLKDRGGAIVNVAAAAATKAAAGMGPYAASKAAVLRLTESLAEELKDDGVRVNAVSPTIIDTARNRADMPSADFSRWVQPADLAQTICFLLSDAARAITGANVLVAGRV